MAVNADKIVKQAEAWIGLNEANGTHRVIIDVYNAHTPRARGYKVQYTDAWCATFVSAVSIRCGATAIMPTECSCQKMIELYKKLGSWVENENRIPNAGDIIFYDWQDSGIGDNQGSADHVGIVQKADSGKIWVIEGNYSNSVKVRQIAVNGRYIRGYGIPKYGSAPATEQPAVPQEPAKTEVKLSISLPMIQKGDLGKFVAVAQVLLGVTADGDFGKNTRAATIDFQEKHKLEVDGVIGAETWGALFSQ